MKKLVRSLSFVLALVMLLSLFVACGSKQSSDTTTSSQTTADKTTSEATKLSEPIKLKMAVSEKEGSKELNAIISNVKEKLNIDLEPVTVDEEKLNLQLFSETSDLDFFYSSVPSFAKFVDAEVVIPLEGVASKAGVDLKAKFGNNLPMFKDQAYLLPNTKDVWMTLYNKKIFDDAGVPYPTAEGWTWSKYIETAKKLTNPEKGIWGSAMTIEWDSYRYMIAHQKGVSDYKADGTSNFDDPAFSESLKFLHDICSVDKIQPDLLTTKSKKIQYDLFTTGKVAMNVNGGWTSFFVTDKKQYPRDWKYGVLPMPYPDGGKPTTLTVTGGYGILKSSKNQDTAFTVIEYLAENEYTFNSKRVPTRQDLSRTDLDAYLNNTLIKGFEDDGVVADDYLNAWYNPDVRLVNEKVVGKADTAINKIFIDEGDLYLMNKRSLEDTMKAIKQKADEAIAAAK